MGKRKFSNRNIKNGGNVTILSAEILYDILRNLGA
jgi:hypothetical protein